MNHSRTDFEVGLAFAVSGEILTYSGTSRTFWAVRSPGTFGSCRRWGGLDIGFDGWFDLYDLVSDFGVDSLVFGYSSIFAGTSFPAPRAPREHIADFF